MTEFMNVLRDLASGALQLRELPGFLFYALFGKRYD